MDEKDVPLKYVDAAMTGASPGCRDDARFYLANAYDAIREDILWEAVNRDLTVTCACGMEWFIIPSQGPDPGHSRTHCASAEDATLQIKGQVLRVHRWTLSPLADWANRAGQWQLSGWLREFDRSWDIYNGTLERVVVPGRQCETGQRVHVDVTGYGNDRGFFLKVRWGNETK